MMKKAVARMLVTAVLMLASVSASIAMPLRTSRTTPVPFTSREGGFSVLMPGTPMYKTRVLDTNVGQIIAHYFMLESQDGTYMVMYNDFPMQPSDSHAMLSAVRNGNAQGGKLIAERDISVDGYPGKLVQVEKGEYTVINAIFLVDQRLYQVMFSRPKTEALPAEAAEFFRSFKLIGSSRA